MACIGLICISVLVWRIFRFNRLFKEGLLVRGHISNVSISGDRGKVYYTYVFEGERIFNSNPIHKNKWILALCEWEEVDIVVDRHNPKHAAIRKLYV